MMRRIIAIVLLLAAISPARAGSREISGMWTASKSEHRPDDLSLSFHIGESEHTGQRFDRSELAGLTAEQVSSDTRTPVRFALRREAGTLEMEGTFHRGQGSGEFTFTPNADFPNTLHSLGVEFSPEHGDRDEELFHLTLFDVSSKFIRSMRAIGYDVPLEKFIEFRIFGVNPEYVREMEKVGFGHLDASKLVETRIHGATPEYIRQMRASGDDLTLDQYIESRIFQVTPEFAAEMARAGYSNLDRDVLVQFRIHGVTTEFIDDLRRLGYSHVPAQKLVEMRIHGVTPEFIRRVEKAGYHRVPIDKLVQMRIFNIEPEMVKALDQ